MTRLSIALVLLLPACAEEEDLTVPTAITWGFPPVETDDTGVEPPPEPANAANCDAYGYDQVLVVWEQSYTEGSRQSTEVACTAGEVPIEMQKWEWTSYGVYDAAAADPVDEIVLNRHVYGDRVLRGDEEPYFELK